MEIIEKVGISAILGTFIMFWMGYWYGSDNDIVLGIVAWVTIGVVFLVLLFLSIKTKQQNETDRRRKR